MKITKKIFGKKLTLFDCYIYPSISCINRKKCEKKEEKSTSNNFHGKKRVMAWLEILHFILLSNPHLAPSHYWSCGKMKYALKNIQIFFYERTKTFNMHAMFWNWVFRQLFHCHFLFLFPSVSFLLFSSSWRNCMGCTLFNHSFYSLYTLCIYTIKSSKREKQHKISIFEQIYFWHSRPFVILFETFPTFYLLH